MIVRVYERGKETEILKKRTNLGMVYISEESASVGNRWDVFQIGDDHCFVSRSWVPDFDELQPISPLLVYVRFDGAIEWFGRPSVSLRKNRPTKPLSNHESSSVE